MKTLGMLARVRIWLQLKCLPLSRLLPVLISGRAAPSIAANISWDKHWINAAFIYARGLQEAVGTTLRPILGLFRNIAVNQTQ